MKLRARHAEIFKYESYRGFDNQVNHHCRPDEA